MRIARDTRLIPIALIALGVVLPPAMADTMEYQIATTASGTLGTSSFTDALVTLTLIGDTSTEVFSPDGHAAVFGTEVVTISSLGTATLLGSTTVVYNPPSGFVTFEHLDDPSDVTSGTAIIGIIDPSLIGYDLETPFGPLTSTGGPASGSMTPTFFPTNVGDLHLDFGSGAGTATFTATAVPEPSSVLLLGSLLAISLVVYNRRMFRRS